MHIWNFTHNDNKTLISAESQTKAIEIYEKETGNKFVSTVSRITDGVPQMTPNQQYGDLLFLFSGDLPVRLPVTATIADNYASDDADNWAAHWPNQMIEFAEVWGEQ